MRTFVMFLFLFVFTDNYAQTKTDSLTRNFNEYLNFNDDYKNGMVVVVPVKENTQGSPYLFKNWAKGEVILDNNQRLQEPDYSLNYDKMLHKLILKLPGNKILFINMKYVSCFILTDSISSYTLLKIPLSTNYLMQLYRGSQYSLYKSTDTNFYPADYENNGISEKGFKYDRYVDKVYYYLIDSLKKGYNIRSGDKSDLKKLQILLPLSKDYFKENPRGKNLEDYLVNLTIFLNNKR